MSDGRGAEELASQAADAVRGAIAAAEERAAQIVREADDEAARIRDRAEGEAKAIRERGEADARAQIDAARKALDELGGSLAAAVSAATPNADSAPDQAEQPEPEPAPAPEESPGAPEAPVSPPAPTEPEQEAATEAPAGNGDDAAQRLAAMMLAIDGKDRAEIESALAEKFGEGDRTALLDDVLSRAGRS